MAVEALSLSELDEDVVDGEHLLAELLASLERGEELHALVAAARRERRRRALERRRARGRATGRKGKRRR